MNKYCIISTAIDDETVAEKIIDELLRKRLVSSVQKKKLYPLIGGMGKLKKIKNFFYK